MGSLVAYGFLAYMLTRITVAHFPRRAAIALLAGLVLLIGFSRICLGVHFMSDVIGGYAAGLSGSRSVSYDPPDASLPARVPNPAWPEAPAGISSLTPLIKITAEPSLFMRQNILVGKLPRRPSALP
jgi:membrane-associated phospholipid phosphatase